MIASLYQRESASSPALRLLAATPSPIVRQNGARLEGKHRLPHGRGSVWSRTLVLVAMFPIVQNSTAALDPVCGMRVDPEHAAGTSTYQGQSYYFCSAGCR